MDIQRWAFGTWTRRKSSTQTFFDAKVLVDIGRLAMIGTSMREPKIAVCVPYNEEDPHPGNGVMVAFPGGSKDGAAALYRKAISLGATCDGEPGQRVENMFYGA